jgi:hypothetical protein
MHGSPEHPPGGCSSQSDETTQALLPEKGSSMMDDALQPCRAIP